MNAWAMHALPLTAYASEPNPAQSRYAPPRRAAPPNPTPGMDGQPEARQRASDGDFWTVSGGGVYDGRMNGKPDNSHLEQVTRTASGQLRPGSRLNPHGRPPGSGGGFRAALQMVVDVANRNQDLIRHALQEEAQKNPARFARQFILPNIPHKERKAFRERIRQMEITAYEEAKSRFSSDSKTENP